MADGASSYHKPTAFERVFGRLLGLLVRIGLVRGHFYLLEVRGRHSGRLITLPIDLLEIDGRRYLVSARGNSQWVRNARAAREIVLARAMRRRRYAVHELPASLRPPILKTYLDRFAVEVQRFFPVAKGSAVEAFYDVAERYPVFELLPAAAGAPGAAAAGERP